MVIRRDRPIAWSALAHVSSDSEKIRRALRAIYDEESTRSALAQAYTERFRPIEEELQGADDLIVVPSPAMAGVPADALLDTEGRFLGDHFAISYAPSATLYTWITERAPPETRVRNDRPALLVGDPPFRKDGTLAAGSYVPDILRSAARGNRDALNQLPALPGTAAEVRSLQEIFPDHTVLLGKDASEQRLNALARDLARYRVLHLATHGIPDDARPDLSALVFSQVGLPDPLERVLAGERVIDGIVTAGEIVRDWELDADLVTLSACETGLGKKIAGEGYVGLAYAFYQAGARSQLVGLWQVEDVATALLMRRFYDNWVNHSMTKASALRDAKQWLRTLTFHEIDEARQKLGVASDVQPRGASVAHASDWYDEAPYAHPFFWAPFVLLGDPS